MSEDGHRHPESPRDLQRPSRYVSGWSGTLREPQKYLEMGRESWGWPRMARDNQRALGIAMEA